MAKRPYKPKPVCSFCKDRKFSTWQALANHIVQYHEDSRIDGSVGRKRVPGLAGGWLHVDKSSNGCTTLGNFPDFATPLRKHGGMDAHFLSLLLWIGDKHQNGCQR